MKEELEKLIDLQKTDTNIRRLKKAIETADERRAEIEQEFEQHASSIRDIQATRDKANAERAEFEKQIAENKTYLERADRNLKHSQNQKEYETAMRETDAHALLTPRELEVLAALAEGMTNKAIARRLNISLHTVKFHVESLFRKLGARTRTEAVAKASERRRYETITL